MNYNKWLESLDYCEILLARLIQLNDGTRAIYVHYKDSDSVGRYVRMKNEIKTIEELIEVGLLYTEKDYQAMLTH